MEGSVSHVALKNVLVNHPEASVDALEKIWAKRVTKQAGQQHSTCLSCPLNWSWNIQNGQSENSTPVANT